ncbi:tripartite tricarboxylate transporter substrate binding protein [uncultured Cohaesibacter sp.]|uniref:Bug family tripartite tricarboxylate transporter substrate binding protein n=1 Tax=uncultured Cohaesibacter sp. TaxID=1002546 RepID=UPI00292D36B9|nr:tripartite tricarboxylate transporter substrate binding protein [uncultured Cohaesibacter sp.]
MLFRKMMLAALAIGMSLSTAVAQDWPNGPIKMIVPTRPGGGSDISARIFADYMQRKTGASIAVVNQPVGGGNVAFEELLQAKPDGQTLVFYHIGIIINSNTGRYNRSLDEFTTIISGQVYPPQVLAASGDAPWNSLEEFVEAAQKDGPGKHIMGVTFGSASHLVAAEVMKASGIKLKLVEASSEVDKVAALQGGQIDLGIMGITSAKQYVDAGQLKVLAILADKKHAKYPDFIPAKDQNVPMSDWTSPTFLWGPPGMDPALVKKINESMKDFGNDPVSKERLAKSDSSFTYMTVEESNALMHEKDKLYSELAKSVGLKR